jgi:Nucleotide modification associated domain 2
MAKIYSYILKHDSGAAPNPFWKICTLTICKPAIRRKAQIGDWIIGTGAKSVKCKDGRCLDLSGRAIYAMKVTDKKTLHEYNIYCKKSLPNKIPTGRTTDWRIHVGDCIYDYSSDKVPKIRKGVHNEANMKNDLSGKFALLSKDFYYFGREPKPLPPCLRNIIKRFQGHRVIEQQSQVILFEKWIRKFTRNKIYADPQMSWLFNQQDNKQEKTCAAKRRKNGLKCK